MEGGLAIILLLIIVVVAGGIGIALYLTGGALWAGKTAKGGDKIEGGTGNGHRPEHKTPTSPTMENTEVVGADKLREDA
jgi:hypothetical protein